MKKLILLLSTCLIIISGCSVLSYPAKNMSTSELKAKYPSAKQTTILNIKKGDIEIGMTKQMVYDAWGRPFNTYTTQSVYGNRQQWQYGGYLNATYLYFEDGILTSVSR